jgi:hypothetical protein
MDLMKPMMLPLHMAVAAFSMLPCPVTAQWLDLPTPGIPRSADGKPDMKAPLPRTANGRNLTSSFTS